MSFFEDNKNTLLLVGGGLVLLGAGYYLGKRAGAAKADEALKQYMSIAQSNTMTAAEKSAAAAAVLSAAQQNK